MCILVYIVSIGGRVIRLVSVESPPVCSELVREGVGQSSDHETQMRPTQIPIWDWGGGLRGAEPQK